MNYVLVKYDVFLFVETHAAIVCLFLLQLIFTMLLPSFLLDLLIRMFGHKPL